MPSFPGLFHASKALPPSARARIVILSPTVIVILSPTVIAIPAPTVIVIPAPTVIVIPAKAGIHEPSAQESAQVEVVAQLPG